MSCWFSSAAVLPALSTVHGLTDPGGALLAACTPLGFVIGSLLSAAVNLADRWRIGHVMSCAAAFASAANLLLLAHTFELVVLGRLLVGCALAGVYAPGLKLLASHYRRTAGTAMALAVGALALGSASSHLAAAAVAPTIGGVTYITSIAATAASVIFHGVPTGRHHRPAPGLQPAAALRALRLPAVRRVTFGYLGHMWELYALWARAPVVVAVAIPTIETQTAGYVLFGSMGMAGLGGCVAAGVLADRHGRVRVARAALALSGGCAAASPLLFSMPPAAVTAVLTLWGGAVIADSAQFSAATAELGDTRYVGSLLTLQTALGFALAALSIQLTPVWASWLSDRYALLPLTLGPVAGLLFLRRHPSDTAR